MNASAFLNFGKRKDGLIVIIQNRLTKEVLMHGWMDYIALHKTIQTGEVWLRSSSRKELWHKGASSDSVMKVKAIKKDCDEDAILLLVDVTGTGTACHRETVSCFDDFDLDWLDL